MGARIVFHTNQRKGLTYVKPLDSDGEAFSVPNSNKFWYSRLLGNWETAVNCFSKQYDN